MPRQTKTLTYRELNKFVDGVIVAHRNGVSLAAIKKSLVANGMSDTEVATLLDVIVLETRRPAKKARAKCA